MALTELQLPLKVDFYRAIQNAATDINSQLSRYSDLSEFLARVDSTDLDSMGVAIGQVRTDLVNFRIMLNELLAFLKGESTTQTIVPEVMVESLRRL